MFTTKMKQELIDKIQSISDENILEEVYRVLEAGSADIETVVLSEDQKNFIDKGLQDIEQGKYVSDEQANQEIEEWLRK